MRGCVSVCVCVMYYDNTLVIALYKKNETKRVLVVLVPRTHTQLCKYGTNNESHFAFWVLNMLTTTCILNIVRYIRLIKPTISLLYFFEPQCRTSQHHHKRASNAYIIFFAVSLPLASFSTFRYCCCCYTNMRIYSIAVWSKHNRQNSHKSNQRMY